MEIKEKVLEVLKGSTEPLKSGEIAEKVDLDIVEVDKAIKVLKKLLSNFYIDSSFFSKSY